MGFNLAFKGLINVPGTHTDITSVTVFGAITIIVREEVCVTVEFMSTISETCLSQRYPVLMALVEWVKTIWKPEIVDRESNTRRLSDRMAAVQRTTTRAFSKDVVLS
jgi:hypothetical protein